MELIPKSMNVSDKECIGCKRHKRDIMITATKKENDTTEFIDIFLTQEEAINFHKELAVSIIKNKLGKE